MLEAGSTSELIDALMPMTVIGATFPADPEAAVVRGRQYPWGYVSVDDAKTNDLTSLRQILLMYHPLRCHTLHLLKSGCI